VAGTWIWSAYADTLGKGARPNEPRALIEHGPMVAPPQVPGSMPPAG